MAHRNHEHYSDPTAGAAVETIFRESERRAEVVQAQKDYYNAINALRELAKQHGFEFTIYNVPLWHKGTRLMYRSEGDEDRGSHRALKSLQTAFSELEQNPTQEVELDQ